MLLPVHVVPENGQADAGEVRPDPGTAELGAGSTIILQEPRALKEAKEQENKARPKDDISRSFVAATYPLPRDTAWKS